MIKKKLQILSFVAILIVGCAHNQARLTESEVLAIAEPALWAQFPETFAACKPYRAVYSNGVWWVHGTLPRDTAGGTPEAKVRDAEGKIVEVYDTQ